SRERRIDEVDVAKEAQRALPCDARRAALPMLPAFDEQRVARVVRIVEPRVVAQPLSRAMAYVDDDVFGYRERLRELDPLPMTPGERKRRAGIGHRMQVEQKVGCIVERTQLARTREFARAPLAV